MVLPKDLNRNVVYLGPDKGVLGRYKKTTGLITKKYFFDGSSYGFSAGELEQVVAETPEETKEREGKWAQIHAENKKLQDEDDARSAAKEEAARGARDAADAAAAAQKARDFYKPHEMAAERAASNGTPGGRRRRRSTSKRSKKKKSHTRRRRHHK